MEIWETIKKGFYIILSLAIIGGIFLLFFMGFIKVLGMVT